MDRLRDVFWPLDSFHEVSDLPENAKLTVRMKNRWRLPLLLPFIQRWFAVVGVLGLMLLIADRLPDGLFSLVVHISLFSMWCAALFFTAFLIWLYSMRPR